MANTKDSGSLKIKKKSIKQQTENKEPVKVDLSKKAEETVEPTVEAKVDLTQEKPKEDAVQEQSTNDSDAAIEQPKDSSDSEKVVEEVRDTETKEVEEVTPLQEVTDEPIVETKTTVEKEQPVLPENIEKLVKFMEETNGTIEDFVRLNADYSNVDSNVLLKEYYKQSKPHLNDEEIKFIMEENFDYDEDVDEERDIKRKKLAYKEEVAKAKNFLDDLKNKYYDQVRLRPGVTEEQQKAIDFFNRYKKNQEVALQQHEDFKQKTSGLFNEEFKGFDFAVGEKKFRYGVKNPSEVAKAQSNLQDFVQRFLDDKGNVKDTQGYHKAIFAARNADKIAHHFYEQGKADAVKDVVNKSKNVSTEARTSPSGDVFVGGLKVRAISGSDTSKLKIKKR
jgi:hypothetical protein|tara:strand:- start:2370 stop:3545 length:1176 start_codon:yes stop_codon:yes gene_type:complete